MRHVFTPPVAPGPRRMGEAAAPARLVTAAGGAQRVSPRRPGTPFAAINLTAIAMAADQHLRPTAPAQKEPRRRRREARCVNPASTRPSPAAIIPRHSCLARCGHGADATAKLGSAPCRSPNRMVFIAPAIEGETAPPSIPVSGCPGGQTGTPHARRSVAREGTAQRARVPPVRYLDNPMPVARRAISSESGGF
jgi:hypothetical protein